MYNKSAIMSDAWEIRKSTNVSMAIALKAAWARHKAIKAAEEIAEDIDWNKKIAVKDWVKYGKNRTYISVRVYTNAWNLKREINVGYVDNMTGEYVAA